MPNGSQITGEDGIINLRQTDGTDIGEVPCLESFSLNASANLQEKGTKCMKSNDDGGSSSDGGWQTNSVSSKSWSGTMEFYWQKDQAIPAAVKLDITNVGDEIEGQFFPNDNTTGDVIYSGNARIEDVATNQDADGDVKCTVTIKGNGPLVKAAVV